MPKKSAILGSREISGVPLPDSHLEMVWGTRNKYSASWACVMFFDFLNVPIFSPIVSRMMHPPL